MKVSHVLFSILYTFLDYFVLVCHLKSQYYSDCEEEGNVCPLAEICVYVDILWMINNSS